MPPGGAGALAAALDHALSMQPSDRLALGARARASVLAHFTVGAMQGAPVGVYRGLLA